MKKKLKIPHQIDDYLQDSEFEPVNHLIQERLIKRKTTK